MKTKILGILCILLACSTVSAQEISSPSDVKQWVETRFAKGKNPPFSFIYGGKKSADFIKKWQYRAEKLPTTELQTEKFLYTYSDKSTGLTVKCTVTCFTDFPAVEWVLNFYNASGKNTPLIEDAKVVDESFTTNGTGSFFLYRNMGSSANWGDFRPVDKPLTVGATESITHHRGRSSSFVGMPFFNIEMPGSRGIMVAVGWTGMWFADMLPKNDKTLDLKSGMIYLKTTLYPKEEIRTPKICLLFWNGDRMVGHNQFRRLVLAHYSRKINGSRVEYPLSCSLDPAADYSSSKGDFSLAMMREDFTAGLVRLHQQYNMLPETYWLDAGWFSLTNGDGTWWQNVGNWSVDKIRFPNGLKPLSDAAHNAGAKFLVWLEPERVFPGTETHREHPEWLLSLPDKENLLFDLGNPEARMWLTNRLSGFIKKEGVDCYRQDANIEPLWFWNAYDAPDRIGMKQIKYIEGLYAFWDSLTVRFPNLLIDNCSSGGQRIDLETISRSAPLWRSDVAPENPDVKQDHTYALNLYLPIHGAGAFGTDNYMFRSALSTTMLMSWETTGIHGEPAPMIRKRIKDYKELRPYFYGDYYPLTDNTNDRYLRTDVWMAYQMNRPEERDGIILAFRRADCKNDSISIKPCGLEKSAEYELFYEDYDIRVKKQGSEIMDGFNISIPTRKASLLIRYKKIN